MNEELRQKPKE